MSGSSIRIPELRPESTFSIFEIPKHEREDYLLNLPPQALQWALSEACQQLKTPGQVFKDESDKLLWWAMQACGAFGLVACSEDIENCKSIATNFIQFLAVIIVSHLNDREYARLKFRAEGDK